MKEKDLFSKQWNDLVFEHRNKDYGAYKLRSETGRRYTWSVALFLGLLFLACLPVVIFMILSRPAKVSLSDPVRKITRFEGIRIKEARPVRRPPCRKELTLADKSQEHPFSREVDQVAAIAHPEDKETASQKIEDVPEDSMDVLRKESRLNLAKGSQQTKGVIIDTIPRYPTGLADFMKWLNKYMVYPQSCLSRKEGGRVVAAFIVEADGSVTDIHIVKGDSRELNHEVLRVLRRMPKWIPGKRNGKPIRSQVTLPVEFQFDDVPFS